MARKVKYGKILLVVFITVLIWVWADLAQDEEFPVSGARITVDESAHPGLWFSFNGESSVSIENIILKGPAVKVADVKRKLKAELLIPEFFLDPAQEEVLTIPGKHHLDVLNLLRKNDKIKKQFGLAVESCEPGKITVNVVQLVEMPLDVECLDENGTPLTVESIEPARVVMLVTEDWLGNAEVQLTRSEKIQAKSSVIEKIPYITLPGGQIRQARTPVKITLPTQEDTLVPDRITSPTLGFTFSPTLQGKYKVELTNLNAVMSAIAIRAAPEAKQAYENKIYQVILELRDSDKDANPDEFQTRELIYNFPEEYVRSNEIKLDQPPVEARFRLIPLPSAAQ